MKRWLTALAGIMALILLGGAFLTPGSALAFGDVKGHWAQLDIELLASHEVIEGYPSGSFAPEKHITRAEFAKVLIKALGLEDEVWALETVPAVFRDVGSRHWARGYIQLTYELGIIKGYDDGNFRPEDPIKRAEIAAMLVRALRMEGERAILPTYKDADQVPGWARNVVAIASDRKLVGGYPDRTFRPGGLATRAEAAAMVNRLLDQLGSKYHFYGTVDQVSAGSGTIRLSVEGSTVEVRVTSQTKVYLGQQLGKLADLGRALPLPAYINLGPDGTASFIHVLFEPKKENAIRLQFNSTSGQDTLRAGELSIDLPNMEGAWTASSFTSGIGQGRSLSLTKKETGATELAGRTGADGRGVVVALIDTGIDPAHPDLLATSTGLAKIADFRDVSGEGRVATPGVLLAGKDSNTIGGQQYNFRGMYSQSGLFRYGFLEEARVGIDFNGNGTMTDRFLVVVADPWKAGQYDTVYIDTNSNRSLVDEVPLREFRQTQDYASFPGSGWSSGISFVVCEIHPKGTEVLLGFDANGHGTQVAGVVAANGAIQGVAPGAQLVVIKAVDKNGQTDWDKLSNAIRFAAESGAQVINLSLAHYRDVTSGFNTLTQLVDRMTEQYGVVFTIAAGNKGPGLASLATPGNARSAIGVGAYIAPAMWLEDYGYQVPRETLWYFSSAGPRQDGMMGPAVIAPGSAVSTHPTWMGSGYALVEGTSIAAAHAAGVVALLLDSAARQKLVVSPASIKQALIAGARPIEHFSPAEAGAGALNAATAWSSLRRLPPHSPVVAYTYNRFLGLGEGLYARDFIPGQLPFRMVNQASEPITVFWESTTPWMHTVPRQTLLPPGINRRVSVEYQVPEEPGLYTGLIKGIVPTSPGMDLRLMATVVRPYPLTKEHSFRQELNGQLDAGQHYRYFFNIPEGAGRASFNLEVPLVDGRFQGRVRFHLVSPDGQETFTSDFAGVGHEGTIMHKQVIQTIDNPLPGNWEVVVYSSAALSLYGRQESSYTLTVQALEVTETKPLAPRWLISVNPRNLEPGKLNYITLQVRDPATLRPVDTELEVNGRVMEVRGGRLTFSVIPKTRDYVIKIK
ncbi:MAG: S8 family serine peptidase [Bacillota bacterium]